MDLYTNRWKGASAKTDFKQQQFSTSPRELVLLYRTSLGFPCRLAETIKVLPIAVARSHTRQTWPETANLRAHHSQFPKSSFRSSTQAKMRRVASRTALPHLAGSPPSPPPLSLHLSSSSPSTRLSLISQHLSGGPSSVIANSARSRSISPIQTRRLSSASQRSMSSQPEHPTLLIPGPIEFDDDVLQSMSHYRSVLAPCTFGKLPEPRLNSCPSYNQTTIPVYTSRALSPC